MDEELLISLVQKYRELYDLEDSRYHDEQRRTNIWEEKAGIMDKTPNACKEKWKKIRENFRKATNLRKTKSGQAAKNFKAIRYSKELSFLTPYLRSESVSLTNVPTPPNNEDDEQSYISSPPSTPGSSEVSATTTDSPKSVAKKMKTGDTQSSTVSLFKSYLDKKYSQNRQEEDPIVSFFNNLGQTVKQFPPDLRVRVKREVFNIVSEAEDEFIRRNDTAQTTFLNDAQPATVLISSSSQLQGPSTYMPQNTVQSSLISTQNMSSAPFYLTTSQIRVSTPQTDSGDRLAEFLAFQKQ